ncbi:hypothetical protein D9M69_551210 [compost metagenome]
MQRQCPSNLDFHQAPCKGPRGAGWEIRERGLEFARISSGLSVARGWSGHPMQPELDCARVYRNLRHIEESGMSGQPARGAAKTNLFFAAASADAHGPINSGAAYRYVAVHQPRTWQPTTGVLTGFTKPKNTTKPCYPAYAARSNTSSAQMKNQSLDIGEHHRRSSRRTENGLKGFAVSILHGGNDSRK